MEKRDIIVIIVAVFIVLIMAMYIKPLVTGKPVQLIPDELSELFRGDNQSYVNNSTISANVTTGKKRIIPTIGSIQPEALFAGDDNNSVIVQGQNFTESMNISFSKDGVNQTVQTEIINGSLVAGNVSLSEGKWIIKIVDSTGNGTTYNTTQVLEVYPAITPVPTWDGKQVTVGLKDQQSGAYIYPRSYPLSENPIYSFKQESAPLLTYTAFSGKKTSLTNNFTIPTNYWELWYTVDVDKNLQKTEVTTGSLTEKSETGVKTFKERQDSTSVVIPRFSIRVFDDVTGNEVRYISPPGGLNPRLWEGDFASPDPITWEGDFKPKSPSSFEESIKWDPRPWKEKFFEGNRSYFLKIDSENILSYGIQIKVPDVSTASVAASKTVENKSYSMNLMEDILQSYIQGVNGNISDPLVFDQITKTLSVNIISQYSRDDIYREITRMKNAGIILEDFTPSDVFILGLNGSIKGYLSYDTGSRKENRYIDIPFIQDYDGWKLNELTLIKN